jgi:hypothetical protein
MKSKNIASQFNRLPETKRAAALKILAERGDTDKIIDDKEHKQVIKTIKIAQALEKDKDILKFLPQYAANVGFKGKTGREAIEEALKAQKPADIEKLNKGIFDNPDVLGLIPYIYTQDKLAKLSYHGSDIINKIKGSFDHEYKTNKEELIRRNNATLRYTHSALGSSLFGPVGNLEEIEGKKQQHPSGFPPNWRPGPGDMYIPPKK